MELSPEDLKLSPEELSKKIEAHYSGALEKKTELEKKLKIANNTIANTDNVSEEYKAILAENKKLKEASMTDAERRELEKQDLAQQQTDAANLISDLKKENAKIKKDSAIDRLIQTGGVIREGLENGLRFEIGSKLVQSEDGSYMFNGKPMADGFNEFAESTAGQAYFAPRNSGGGGQGSGGGGVSLKEYVNDNGTLNQTKLARLRKGTPEDVATADKVVAAHSSQNK